MSDLADQMKADALEAQKFSRKHLILELDFSETSIDYLESAVETIEYAIPAGKSEENVEMLSRIWGAYLGETLRKQCGGQWVEEAGQPTLRGARSSAQPQEMVRKRLVEGGDSLGDYFREMKKQL